MSQENDPRDPERRYLYKSEIRDEARTIFKEELFKSTAVDSEKLNQLVRATEVSRQGIHDVRGTQDQMRTEMSLLKGDVKDAQGETKEVKGDLKELRGEVKAVSLRLAQLDIRMEDLIGPEGKISGIKEDVRTLTHKTEHAHAEIRKDLQKLAIKVAGIIGGSAGLGWLIKHSSDLFGK